LADVVAEMRKSGVQAQSFETLESPVNLRSEPDRRAEVAPGSDFHRAWVAARATSPTRITLP
jgi:hypothetical protein